MVAYLSVSQILALVGRLIKPSSSPSQLIYVTLQGEPFAKSAHTFTHQALKGHLENNVEVLKYCLYK